MERDVRIAKGLVMGMRDRLSLEHETEDSIRGILPEAVVTALWFAFIIFILAKLVAKFGI